MNWKLTQKCIDDPQLEDWSDWQIMESEKIHVLDEIYDRLKEEGRATGVIKLRAGAYIAHGGSWLF